MSKMIDVAFKIPAPPEGWVYDQARSVNPGEYYWDREKWRYCNYRIDLGSIVPVAIRKIQWRTAVKADVGMADARFWDANSFAWSTGELIYVFEGSVFPFAIVPDKKPVHVKRAAQCEVPVLPDEKESNATQDPQRRRVSRDDKPETVTVRKRRKSNTRKGSPKKS